MNYYQIGDNFDLRIREIFSETLAPGAANGKGRSKRRSSKRRSRSSASLKPLVALRGKLPPAQYTALLGQLTRRVYDFLRTYSPPNLPRNYPARTALEYAIHEARSYVCRRYPNQGLIEDGDLPSIVYLVLAACVEHYDFSRSKRAGFMTYFITSIRNQISKMFDCEEQPALAIDQQANPDDGYEVINPERFLARERVEEKRSRISIY